MKQYICMQVCVRACVYAPQSQSHEERSILKEHKDGWARRATIRSRDTKMHHNNDARENFQRNINNLKKREQERKRISQRYFRNGAYTVRSRMNLMNHDHDRKFKGGASK